MYERLMYFLNLVRRHGDDETLPTWQRYMLFPVRVLYAIGHDVAEGQLTLRAMSLVYTTLLSLVPLLAISFSVLKGFGLHNQLEPFLLEFLEPLGERAPEITERVIAFVDNAEVGVLGFIGFVFLFYTVISLLQKVEHSFNHIWRVSQERSLGNKVRDYLSLVVVGPLLVISAMGLVASLMASEFMQVLTAPGPVEQVVAVVTQYASLILIVVALTFIYTFMPNAQVKFHAAALGGVAAGLLWMVVGWGFTSFVVGSVRYDAIYSAFAALILFMIWLYLVWLIVLVGSAISFYVQKPHYIGIDRDPVRYGIRFLERTALLVSYHIVRTYYGGEEPLTADSLAQRTGAPMPAVCEALQGLERSGLVQRTGDLRAGYLPARPPEETSVRSVLDAVRGMAAPGQPGTDLLESVDRVDAVIGEVESLFEKALGDYNLKQLVAAESAPPVREVRS